VSRWLVAPAVLILLLLTAASAGAAHKADAMAVTSWASGANFVFQVQNTGDTVVKSFVLVPGPGFAATGLVSASAGTCQLTGATVSCSGLSLAPGCPCNPGESAYVTLSGSGDTAGSGVVQIVGAAPVATPAATAASVVPVKTPTGSSTTSTTKASIASIRPGKARAGAKVTVTGANLSGTTAVRIGSLAARYTITTNGGLLVTVPKKAVSGKLSVRTSGGWTTSAAALRIA
jgi:hypothetical protein